MHAECIDVAVALRLIRKASALLQQAGEPEDACALVETGNRLALRYRDRLMAVDQEEAMLVAAIPLPTNPEIQKRANGSWA